MSTTTATSSALSARGVCKSFRTGDTDVVVLKGADLDVAAGEFIAIEGRSGSGKSTLLHVLAGLDGADAGTIHAGGAEIGQPAAAVNRWRGRVGQSRFFQHGFVRLLIAPVYVPFSWLIDGIINFVLLTGTAGADRRLSLIRNRQFGFVFQFYHLLPELTVVENVTIAARMGPEGDAKRRAVDLLTQFGLSHRLSHLPGQLSGGERQRVAIARALINNPAVLFADEPTGNLDAETGRQIMDVLEALHRDHGQTIVMVTHDRALAREANRVLVLANGKLEPATT